MSRSSMFCRMSNGFACLSVRQGWRGALDHSGMNLLQDLRAAMPRGMTRPIGVKPEGSKVDRMAAQSAKIEAGHVHLPKSAAWLGEFLTELFTFPHALRVVQGNNV